MTGDRCPTCRSAGEPWYLVAGGWGMPLSHYERVYPDRRCTDTWHALQGKLKVGATFVVSPQAMEDVKLDMGSYIAERLTTALFREAANEHMRVLMDTFEIEKTEGGYWVDAPRSWWQRLLRRPLGPGTWVGTVGFRATATAEPVFEESS